MSKPLEEFRQDLLAAADAHKEVTERLDQLLTQVARAEQEVDDKKCDLENAKRLYMKASLER